MTGHEFISEEALSALAVLHNPPGRPREWRRNEWGQPEWLLELPAGESGRWAVLIPPGPDHEPPPAFMAARGLDRHDQGLGRWGEGKTISSLRPMLEVGPAMMPAITWPTRPLDRRGHRGVVWTEVETAIGATWLKDVLEWSQADLVWQLFRADVPKATKATLDRYVRDNRALRRKVRRYVEAGRQALCHRGVWPWISVPLEDNGDSEDQGDSEAKDDSEDQGDSEAKDELEEEGNPLPTGWWMDDEVLAHLEAWHWCAVYERPAREALIREVTERPGSEEVPAPW